VAGPSLTVSRDGLMVRPYPPISKYHEGENGEWDQGNEQQRD